MKRLLVCLLLVGVVGCGDPVAELEGKGARFTKTERGEVVGADFLFTKITDEGLVHLKSLPNLQKLIVAGTKITDAGLVHLREIAKLKHLSLADQSLSRWDPKNPLLREDCV